jgi:PKD repeat protein
VGAPVSFNGSASFDPDGDPLTYAWDFGDTNIGTGATASHTYTAEGVYVVTLCVTDNSGAQTCCTTDATIGPAGGCTLPARVFTVGGDKTIRLSSGKPQWCAEVEPIGGDFLISGVNFSTLRLTYNGVSIPALGGKTAVDGDRDKNGILELAACFTKDALRILFAGLPSGNNVVTVTISGDVFGGGSFCGDVSVTVIKSGATALATASVSPNPLNPQATLTFTVSKPGTVKVEMFDVQGRLVRTIMDETYLVAGTYDRTIDGRSQDGRKLASGVYYVRGVTAEGVFKNIITILK